MLLRGWKDLMQEDLALSRNFFKDNAADPDSRLAGRGTLRQVGQPWCWARPEEAPMPDWAGGPK